MVARIHVGCLLEGAVGEMYSVEGQSNGRRRQRKKRHSGTVLTSLKKKKWAVLWNHNDTISAHHQNGLKFMVEDGNPLVDINDAIALVSRNLRYLNTKKGASIPYILYAHQEKIIGERDTSIEEEDVPPVDNVRPVDDIQPVDDVRPVGDDTPIDNDPPIDDVHPIIDNVWTIDEDDVLPIDPDLSSIEDVSGLDKGIGQAGAMFLSENCEDGETSGIDGGFVGCGYGDGNLGEVIRPEYLEELRKAHLEVEVLRGKVVSVKGVDWVVRGDVVDAEEWGMQQTLEYHDVGIRGFNF